LRPQLNPTIFPYTTLFRSVDGGFQDFFGVMATERCHDIELSRYNVGLEKVREALQLVKNLTDRSLHKLKSFPNFLEANVIPGERSEEHTSELQSPCNFVCR